MNDQVEQDKVQPTRQALPPGKGIWMKRQFLALSFGIGAMLLATQHAFAQSDGANPACAARTVVVEKLTNFYGESRQSIGLERDEAVIEVFASLQTGTWTIVVTLPSGVSCIVASGQSYEALPQSIDVPGQDV